nr:unnamed protein product [Callosobruchus analis]
MAPTEKTSANVADKNKCIVCLKKAIKGPKVIQCVSCVNTAHVECVVRSKGDLDDYKCEDCVSESANSSTETVIEKSEKDIDLMVKEREGMLIEIDLLKRLLKEVEEKNALLYYKINVLEDKISNYENLSTISSPSPVLTNSTQTRSTRGAITRAAKKTSVKDQPLVTKKSSSTVLPESERASTSTNGRQQMEPGLTEAVLVEHTDTCEGEGEVTQINASNLNNTAGADSGCGSHDTGWTNVNRRRKRTAVIGSSKDMGNIKVNPKKAFLFVSRLDPSTKTDDLVSVLKSKFPEVTCEKLRSKHPQIYSSFKVSINSGNLDIALDPSQWPEGAYVTKFFQKSIHHSMKT